MASWSVKTSKRVRESRPGLIPEEIMLSVAGSARREQLAWVASRGPGIELSVLRHVYLVAVEVSTQQEIENVFFERPHVVILGAGASIAAVPADRNGKELPDMKGLLRLPRVQELFDAAGGLQKTNDFEVAYSMLRASGNHEFEADQIDQVVREFFSDIEIPDQPAIYDHLLLSLREKDLVATFNWDPLIVQAEMRLRILGFVELPQVVFLHGNVSISACLECETAGLSGESCRKCGQQLDPVPLLYPVMEKDYETDPFIAHAWHSLRWGLKNGSLVSVFGYRAPASDAAAIDEFKLAWGDPKVRQFEQFEIVSRPGSDHEELRNRWDAFIHTHHYAIHDDFYDSWIAHHPRRSGEAYYKQFIEANFIDVNPVPQDLELKALVDWYEELRMNESRDDRPTELN